MSSRRKVVSEQDHDMGILEEAAKGNWQTRTAAANDRRCALPFGAPEGFGASIVLRARPTSQYPAMPVAPAE